MNTYGACALSPFFILQKPSQEMVPLTVGRSSRLDEQNRDNTPQAHPEAISRCLVAVLWL